MTQETQSTAAALSLLDLLLPASAAPQAANACFEAQIDIPPALQARIRTQTQAAAALPDTPWYAALNFLQQRWQASEALQQGLRRGDWLAQVDATRRTGPTGDSANLQLTTDERQLRLSAPADRIDAASASTLLETLVDTTAHLMADLAAPLDTVPAVRAADRQQMLAVWNGAPSPYDVTRTVHGRFAQQAAATPTATALTGAAADDLRLTYAELDAAAERMARQLQQFGVRAGDAVGVMLERAPRAIVALLGILKAGAAYVPVQPNFPAERLAFMLGDAGVRLLVSEHAHAGVVPAGLGTVWLDDPAPDTATLPALQPVAVDGDSRAYVMYTSGSTGVPKGIEICHRSILRLVVDAQYVDLRADEPMLHAAPLGFDAATLEIWGPLLNGGCCVVHDEEMPSGAGLARTIGTHGVKTACSRPRSSTPWSTTTRSTWPACASC